MILDGAGELIVDVLTANRSLSGIPSASAILDTSNYTFHAITYGKDSAGFKQHAHTLNYITSGFSIDKLSVVTFGGETSSLTLLDKIYDISTVYVSSTSASIVKPDARKYHDIVYDSNRGKLVLYGGYCAQITYCSDTWEASALPTTPSSYVWELKSTTGPGPRSNHAMVYHEKLGYTFLFGGTSGGGTYLNDTWMWNGTSWTKLYFNSSPPPRIDHRMVYDSKRNVIVLFGGMGNNGCLGDTWEFTGYEWKPISFYFGGFGYALPTPPARRLFSMTFFKGNRNQVILCGGTDESLSNVKDDIWAYDGSTWTNSLFANINTPTIKIYGATLNYNDNVNYAILYGGASSTATSSFNKIVYKFYEDDSSVDNFYLRDNFSITNSDFSGSLGHAGCYYKNTSVSNTYLSNDKIIKVLSYENNVKSYHTSATANVLSGIYNLLPSPPNPLDRRLEPKSTLPNYSSGVPDVGHCLNSIIDPNLSSYANFIGCFPAFNGTDYWLVSSTDYSLTAASGTLSSIYNKYSIMDSSGFLKFASNGASNHNTLFASIAPAGYLEGAIRPALASLSFPNKVTIKWALPPGDAGGLLLFGGIYQLGLWYLDLKEMLKQGYYPPYNFNTLNNVRKHKLFAKKTFNKDLLYMSDSTGNAISAFNAYLTPANGNYLYFTWELLMV